MAVGFLIYRNLMDVPLEANSKENTTERTVIPEGESVETKVSTAFEHLPEIKSMKNVTDVGGVSSWLSARTSGQRKVFLGIFTIPKKDARLRNIIRTTYLSAKLRHYGAPQICSLANVTDTCQVVYAFLAEQGSPRKFAVEYDMAFLPQSKLDVSNQNMKNRVFRFHEYFRRELSTYNWDYVAYTHCRVVLFPNRIWPPLHFEDVDPTSPYPRPYFYSGFTLNNGSSSDIHDYVIFSNALWHRVVTHPKFQPSMAEDKTDKVLARITRSLGINVTTLPLPDGAYICDTSYYNHFDFVQRWDDYKDSQMGIKYEDFSEEVRIQRNSIIYPLQRCRHGPRMLLGIMTMKEHKYEGRRRHMIRETYLSYFRNYSASEDQQHRICGLHELLANDHQNPNHRSMLLRECQLAYVFIAGGNPTGPKERVYYNTSEPITLPSNESDVVLLNIQENMKEGKTQSYFKYATTVVDEHIYFDYIAKSDSDTLIIPERLLDDTVNHLPPFPTNVRVYGGYRPAARVEFDHIKGPIYWQGSFYFLSIDMARYITSPDCDRHSLALWSEDKSMCNFVHSHPQPIQRIKLNITRKPVDHPLKQIQRYIPRWQAYLEQKDSDSSSATKEAESASEDQ